MNPLCVRLRQARKRDARAEIIGAEADQFVPPHPHGSLFDSAHARQAGPLLAGERRIDLVALERSEYGLVFGNINIDRFAIDGHRQTGAGLYLRFRRFTCIGQDSYGRRLGRIR